MKEKSEPLLVSVFSVAKQFRCQFPGKNCWDSGNVPVPECYRVVSKGEVFSDPIYIECGRGYVSEVSQAGVSDKLVSFWSINAVSTHWTALDSF